MERNVAFVAHNLHADRDQLVAWRRPPRRRHLSGRASVRTTLERSLGRRMAAAATRSRRDTRTGIAEQETAALSIEAGGSPAAPPFLSPFAAARPGSLPQSRAPGRLAGRGRRRRPSSVIGPPLSLRARLAPFAQAASASLHGCPFWSDSHLLSLPRVSSKRGAVQARWRDLTGAKAGTSPRASGDRTRRGTACAK
ncbi:MAG: hypothetical protein K0R41_634 [Geminicoccaceae bacterium]|nr:hypothetical protein [Geminicoccaceae bacterium]